MEQVVFQVIGIAPNSWVLRQNRVMAEKPNEGLKFINYFPGQNSIFEEDIKNKDIKATRVPAFVFNGGRNKTELRVNPKDTALLNYLKSHPDFGKKFEIYSEEIESKKKLSDYDKKELALEYIKEEDTTRLKALAVAILGYDYFGKDVYTLKASLKTIAFENPDKILSARESSSFENKFLSALAFSSGVIQTNPNYTAVVWSDNQGKIMDIAVGENAIDKLSDFLSQKTDQAETLLKEMTKRTGGGEVKLADEVFDEKEITVDEAREKYENKFGKEAPPAQKNNLEWLLKKLKE